MQRGMSVYLTFYSAESRPVNTDLLLGTGLGRMLDSGQERGLSGKESRTARLSILCNTQEGAEYQFTVSSPSGTARQMVHRPATILLSAWPRPHRGPHIHHYLTTMSPLTTRLQKKPDSWKDSYFIFAVSSSGRRIHCMIMSPLRPGVPASSTPSAIHGSCWDTGSVLSTMPS